MAKSKANQLNEDFRSTEAYQFMERMNEKFLGPIANPLAKLLMNVLAALHNRASK